MKPCPEISTFKHVSGPNVVGWISRYVHTAKPPKGAARLEFLPLIFQADTEDRAINIAQDWWSAEQAKEAAKEERLATLRDKRKSV